MDSYIIVGGGLAGLTAANALANHGHKVTVIEKSERLGGRAITVADRGYFLNLGPHALYRGSYAAGVFEEWGIDLNGKIPRLQRDAFLVRGSRRYPFPTSTGALLASRMFSVAEKIEVARLLRLITSPKSTAEGSADDWLAAHARSGNVRDFLSALIRVSTYTADLPHLAARAMMEQVRCGLAHSVVYIDHGWQSLVNALADRARSRGVEIRCGEPVVSLKHLNADGVILAVPPASVEQITGIRLPTMRPVRLASLDLGLRRLPPGSASFMLAVDRPLYFSVHSKIAKLAPAGAALVHVGKYLAAESSDPRADREELERYADLAMPGWRAEVELERFLPNMTVVHSIASVDGRPDVDALQLDGVALAGDWVGPEGMLADAAVASALRAAEAVQRVKQRVA